MKNVREHIEQMMISRLLRKTPVDNPVDNSLFDQVIHDMDRMITNILNETHIPGFTEDDLRGFIELKTHQMLRQNKWDQTRRPFGIFSISYRNLIRDILRMRERALRNGMEEDGLDYCILFSEQLAQRKHITTHWEELRNFEEDN